MRLRNTFKNQPKLSTFKELVYVWVLVLEEVGEVLDNETDRVWSEALFALTCFSNTQ
jgi:hypothetical protein